MQFHVVETEKQVKHNGCPNCRDISELTLKIGVQTTQQLNPCVKDNILDFSILRVNEGYVLMMRRVPMKNAISLPASPPPPHTHTHAKRTQKCEYATQAVPLFS